MAGENIKAYTPNDFFLIDDAVSIAANVTQRTLDVWTDHVWTDHVVVGTITPLAFLKPLNFYSKVQIPVFFEAHLKFRLQLQGIHL